MTRSIDISGLNATIEFADALIPVVYQDGKPRIILRYVFNDLGLEVGSALKHLKQKPWADISLATAHAVGGQNLQMQTASASTFLIWLSGLSYVPDSAKARLRRYQDETALALSQYAEQAFPQNAA